MASLPREAFLSHASDDKEIAERLAGVLVAHTVPVWYSHRDILGAQQWHDEIGAALHRCDWFLLLLSPSSVRSKWVKRELLYALQDDRYEEHILPLLYRPCDITTLSWTLAQFQAVDLTGEFAAGCRSLLRVWNLELRSDIAY
ncbi:MAG: toll/interleukin-1 receptor domain-containing protein [Bryobacterales bacterium]